ncbi:MAG: hypothetical protein M3Q29_05810 [Chloroflexota bacterium]|nr:hypothetical protein [Chloroflexota bacterium]
MLNNNSYNIVTALHDKSEALAVYDKYIQDAEAAGSQECVQLFRQLQQQDEQNVQTLRQHVEMLVQNGKF